MVHAASVPHAIAAGPLENGLIKEWHFRVPKAIHSGYLPSTQLLSVIIRVVLRKTD